MAPRRHCWRRFGLALLCAQACATLQGSCAAGPPGAAAADDAAPARHKVKLPASCGPGEAYSARESACLPCALGTFKAARGAKPCAPCPTGTTTDAEGGAAVSACSVCKPGHGAAGAFDPAAPECALCAPGTYRSGSGWAGCFPCPKGRVSRAGSIMVEQCVAEFITAGGGTGTPFDILPMARAVLTPAPAGGAADAGAAGCRAACVRAAGAADGCQYFEYRSREAPGMRCWLRALGVGAPASLRSEDATPKVLFMVQPGTYVAYPGHPSDWASLGAPTRDAAASHAALPAALAACDASHDCVGIKYGPGGGEARWRLFTGQLMLDQAGGARVAGAALLPPGKAWAAAPGPAAGLPAAGNAPAAGRPSASAPARP